MESRIHTRFAGVAALAAGLVLAVPAGAESVKPAVNHAAMAADAGWQIGHPHRAAHDRLPVRRTSDFGFFYRDRDGFFFGYDPRDDRRWYRDRHRQYYYDRYYDHRKRRWAHDRRHYRDWYRRYYRHYGDYRDRGDHRRYYRDHRDRRDWDDRRRDRHHDRRHDRRHDNGRDKKHERRRGHSGEHRRGRGHDDDHRRRGRGRD